MEIILKVYEKYTSDEIARMNCTIRRLAEEHYKYGKHMPLVFGKARGIRNVLEACYNVNVPISYVWEILEKYYNEPKE